MPLRAVADCVGLRVSVETRSGGVYRGTLKLVHAQTGTVVLEKVRYRSSRGVQAVKGRCLIRGSRVRLLSLPRVVSRAPYLAKRCFRRADAKKATSAATKKQFVKRGTAEAKLKKLGGAITQR